MKKEKQHLPPLATTVEAAEYLAVSRAHIYSLMDAGNLPSVRVGKARRVPWTQIEAIAGVTRRDLIAAEAEPVTK